MTSYPVEIRRCRHIKTSGAQCGSPALKGEEFCYYHNENRTLAAPIYLDGDRYPDNHYPIPPFEDAHAIQKVLRLVMLLMMERRIDRKDAGLMLYALQIASGNLKRMEEEKPRPTQVVRDPETTGETPLGMTPWSASGEGHDPDKDCDETESDEEDEEYEAGYDDEDEDDEDWWANLDWATLVAKPAETIASLSEKKQQAARKEYLRRGFISREEFDGWAGGAGPEPMVRGVARVAELDEFRRRLLEEGAPGGGEVDAGESLPGTIQACAEGPVGREMEMPTQAKRRLESGTGR